MTTIPNARAEDRWLYLLIGAGALLVALVVLARVEWEPFNIPSASMEPTLQVGDYVFARHYRFIEPRRGDVAVFRHPRDGSYWVKRLVGLPGDKIQLREGTLYVNDVAATQVRAGTYADPQHGIRRELYTETLPNGVAYPVLLDSPHSPPPAKPCDRPSEGTVDLENTCPFLVPPDHYFMLGDNRDNSIDSRLPTLGFVSHDGLVGQMQLLWWSETPSQIGSIVH